MKIQIKMLPCQPLAAWGMEESRLLIKNKSSGRGKPAWEKADVARSLTQDAQHLLEGTDLFQGEKAIMFLSYLDGLSGAGNLLLCFFETCHFL